MGITEIFLNYYQYFLRGTQTTVIVSLITVLLGTVLGCLIALLRLSRFRLCSGFAKLYITVIRGTPLLVQLYIVYYQLHFIPWPEGSILGVELARVMPCILALSMNSTAYVAEVIRSGIQAVDFGQTEAALSCGMTRTQAMVNIILPQAVKNILPALGNEFVTMIKETSIIQYLGVGDPTTVDSGTVELAPDGSEEMYLAVSSQFDDVGYEFTILDHDTLRWGSEFEFYQKMA